MARKSICNDGDSSKGDSGSPSTCSNPTYSKKLVPAKPSKKGARRSHLVLKSMVFLMMMIVAIGLSSAVVVARILIPAATSVVAAGVTGLATIASQSGLYALEHGDAELRKEVLRSILEMDRAQLPEQLDEASSEAFLHALSACKADCDPEVVQLAFEVEQMIFEDIDDEPLAGEK